MEIYFFTFNDSSDKMASMPQQEVSLLDADKFPTENEKLQEAESTAQQEVERLKKELETAKKEISRLKSNLS